MKNNKTKNAEMQIENLQKDSPGITINIEFGVKFKLVLQLPLIVFVFDLVFKFD